jgi:hypothetical protein
MPVHLVAYDFNVVPNYGSVQDRAKEETRTHGRRDRFRETLNETYRTAHELSESAYAIETNASAQEVVAALNDEIEDQDEFYVTTLVGPVHGQGETMGWLRARLGPR